MLTANEAILFKAVLDRIKSQVTEIRYIEQDLGQLENYKIKPAVSWPCALLEIDDIDYSDTSDKIQLAEGFFQVRIGLVQYTQSSNLTSSNILENSLQYSAVGRKVAKALHGWSPPGFNRLLRRKYVIEKRDDDIRVLILRFSIGWKEDLSQELELAPRPDPVVLTT